MFGVKPFHIDGVLKDFNHQIYTENTIFISIIVAIETEFFRKYLGEKAKIARVMPNLGVHVGSVKLDNEGNLHSNVHRKIGVLGTVFKNSVCGFGRGFR